jgi:hypothetical protein
LCLRYFVRRFVDEAAYGADSADPGRTIEVVPPINHEGDITIIPVVEEIGVVERRLVLKEKVRVRHISKKEQHQETVVLRQQEGVIRRKEPDSQVDVLASWWVAGASTRSNVDDGAEH